MSPFDHVFSCRNCRGGIYFSWRVLKVTGHSSFFFCIRAVAVVRVFIQLAWVLRWSCWRTNTAPRESKKIVFIFQKLCHFFRWTKTFLRGWRSPWYNSFYSFQQSILLLLAFPNQSPLSNLLLQRLGCRTDTCTSSAACKIHTEYYLQKLFTIYSISAKTWKNLKRRRIFTKIYNRWTQSTEQEQLLSKETVDTRNNFANSQECNKMRSVFCASIPLIFRSLFYCLRLMLRGLPLFRFLRFFFEKRVPDIIAASEDTIQHGGSTTSEIAKKNVEIFSF